MKYTLCYDLKTTTTNEKEGEIFNFSALLLNEEFKIVKEFDIIHKTEIPKALLEAQNKTQKFYNEQGLNKNDFLKEIEAIFSEYKIKTLMGYDIVTTQNKWLNYHTAIKTNDYKKIDVFKSDLKLLNCHRSGHILDATGQKTKQKLKVDLSSCCLRRSVVIDKNLMSDGVYNCQKTYELYFAQHKRPVPEVAVTPDNSIMEFARTYMAKPVVETPEPVDFVYEANVATQQVIKRKVAKTKVKEESIFRSSEFIVGLMFLLIFQFFI